MRVAQASERQTKPFGSDTSEVEWNCFQVQKCKRQVVSSTTTGNTTKIILTELIGRR